ncbi:MAG: ATP-binding protein [Bacteroidota bacterium]
MKILSDILFKNTFKNIFFKSAALIFALLFSLQNCAADETMPYSFSVQKHYSGWLLKGIDRTFFLTPQPSWSQEAQIAVWSGLDRNNEQIVSLPGVSVISAAGFKNSLLLIVLKNTIPKFLQLDSQLAVIHEIPVEIPNQVLKDITWKFSENGDEAMIIAGNNLFRFSRTFTQISSDAEDAVFLKDGSFAVLEKIGARNILKFFKKDGSVLRAIQLNAGSSLKLAAFDNSVASLQTLGEVTAIEFFENVRSLYARTRIPAQKEFILFNEKGSGSEIAFLKSNSQQYEVVFTKISAAATVLKTVQLPANLIEPMIFKKENGRIIAIFRNGLVTLNENGEILSEENIRAGEWFKNDAPNVRFFNDTLLLSSATRSVFLKENSQPFWFFFRFVETSGRFIFPLLLLAFGLWLLKRYLRQRAILQAVVDLPSSGIVMVLDTRKRLMKVNQSARKLLKMPPKVPLQRMFRYYCQHDSYRELLEFVENAFFTKEEIRRKITLKDGRISEEIICTALPLRSFTGVFRGLVITGTDITEELEKKRLVNWAQLAHDMQTNLSVIRLNAEQFAAEDEGNSSRRKKILFQVGLILQRVRDLVTVGRNDILDISTVNAREMCESVLKEFDEQMFPNVEFSVEAQDFMFSCDRGKLVRALRNAAENAIRALKGKPGKVVLKAWRDQKNVFLSVVDTGAGMNEELQRNMFTPYFTTGQHQGGTGIGTMIMQHVAHLHNGEIIVRSELNKGTEVIFSIPAEIDPFKSSKNLREKSF